MIELNGVRDALAVLTPRAPRFFRAPGRVTIIGDHVDYTEGFTLPMAIDRATVIAAAPRDDRTVRARSVERDEVAEFPLDVPPSADGGWAGYVAEVARALQRRGVAVRGADFAIRTTLPLGAGLASSAALATAAVLAFLDLAAAELSAADIAGVAAEAETAASGHAGSASGPIASVLGRRDHALLVDCRSGEASSIPLALPDCALMICDSHVCSPLGRAALETRRRECDEAAAILRALLPKVKTLRDVSLADFLRTGEKLPALLRKRTRHVVTENVRVLQTVAAVRAADADAIGGRMNESHDSLRDDYDVSSPELDTLVTAARAVRGVYGARMAGPGFGGSTISLVRRDAVAAFRASVTAAYRSAFSNELAVFEVRAADGAAPIS